MTILWIDDDEDLLDPQRHNLLDAGYRVKISEDVDTAYSLLKDKNLNFKGVILDVMLSPGALLGRTSVEGGLRTGVKFLERVKEEGLLKHRKLFVFSHRDSLPDSQHVKSLGFNYHLKQDYKGSKIVELVRSEFGPV